MRYFHFLFQSFCSLLFFFFFCFKIKSKDIKKSIKTFLTNCYLHTTLVPSNSICHVSSFQNLFFSLCLLKYLLPFIFLLFLVYCDRSYSLQLNHCIPWGRLSETTPFCRCYCCGTCSMLCSYQYGSAFHRNTLLHDCALYMILLTIISQVFLTVPANICFINGFL